MLAAIDIVDVLIGVEEVKKLKLSNFLTILVPMKLLPIDIREQISEKVKQAILYQT